MANSFNRYNWNPIRRGYFPQPQVQPHSIKPKVINVPVQFVGGTDERTSEISPATPSAAVLVVPSAAATIQRAVRGFLVRKNARFVRKVAAEVDEMERMIKREEAKIREDARERLRVNEALMALLLRLDSVRGVRDFRKKVIRRVITLQETIDSISAAADGAISAIREDSSSEPADESVIGIEKEADQTLDLEEETNGAEIELKMEIAASAESSDGKSDLLAESNGTISISSKADDLEDPMNESAEESSIYQEDQTLDLKEEANAATTEMEMNQTVGESPNWESNLIGLGINGNGLNSPDAEEVIRKGDDLVASQWLPLTVDSSAAEKREEGIVTRELMENMVAENEKLKEMVKQLCATNAEQCRLMEGLAGRIEHLERFAHRMDRRRKKRGPACSAISSAK